MSSLWSTKGNQFQPNSSTKCNTLKLTSGSSPDASSADTSPGTSSPQWKKIAGCTNTNVARCTCFMAALSLPSRWGWDVDRSVLWDDIQLNGNGIVVMDVDLMISHRGNVEIQIVARCIVTDVYEKPIPSWLGRQQPPFAIYRRIILSETCVCSKR